MFLNLDDHVCLRAAFLCPKRILIQPTGSGSEVRHWPKRNALYFKTLRVCIEHPWALQRANGKLKDVDVAVHFQIRLISACGDYILPRTLWSLVIAQWQFACMAEQQLHMEADEQSLRLAKEEAKKTYIRKGRSRSRNTRVRNQFRAPGFLDLLTPGRKHRPESSLRNRIYNSTRTSRIQNAYIRNVCASCCQW